MGVREKIAADHEPFIHLRGHESAVLCMAYRQRDGVLYSGGVDCAILAWQFPEKHNYTSYGPTLKQYVF